MFIYVIQSNDEIFIEHLIEQERTAEEMRKQIYEQELQKEQEAKQRVKDDLMEALVRRISFKKYLFIFFSSASFRW